MVVEYAKAGPTTSWSGSAPPIAAQTQPSSTCCRPLWFRNTWAWGEPDAPHRPSLRRADDGSASSRRRARTSLVGIGSRATAPRHLLFTENESNNARLFDCPNATPYVKDGINEAIVDGRADTVNPAGVGTKVAAQYRADDRAAAQPRRSACASPRPSAPSRAMAR